MDTAYLNMSLQEKQHIRYKIFGLNKRYDHFSPRPISEFSTQGWVEWIHGEPIGRAPTSQCGAQLKLSCLEEARSIALANANPAHYLCTS
ncbi:hypothetical protein SK128_016064 [Halocaridina rubra]|uniref:Uncharacterized protein n=1 Tax=Halocaridina rubra TaxID=373956 RepID=A0AAN8WI47_HALRR